MSRAGYGRDPGQGVSAAVRGAQAIQAARGIRAALAGRASRVLAIPVIVLLVLAASVWNLSPIGARFTSSTSTAASLTAGLWPVGSLSWVGWGQQGQGCLRLLR
jgi:hypothetical protein